MAEFKIVWSQQSIQSLKSIYLYYREKSPRGALNVKNELLNCPKTILFAEQFQADEINPKYRRIIIRDFKVLYKESNGTVQIMDIISTKQSPDSHRLK